MHSCHNHVWITDRESFRIFLRTKLENRENKTEPAIVKELAYSLKSNYEKVPTVTVFSFSTNDASFFPKVHRVLWLLHSQQGRR